MPATDPPAGAVDAAERAFVLGQGTVEALSMVGLEVCAALRSGRPLHPSLVAAMAHHPYAPDTVSALMFGGPDGREWAVASLSNDRLAEFSAALAAIDRRFRDRLGAVLAQAMRQALRHADVKVRVRAHRRASLGPFLDDLEARRYTPDLLAALSTTTDELIHDRFLEAGDQAAALLAARQRARRKLIARSFDTDEPDWTLEEDRRAGALTAFVVTALLAEAAARLAVPRSEPVFDLRGEQPVDPYLSPRIAADAVKVADGATLAPSTVPTGERMPHDPDRGRPVTAAPLEPAQPGEAAESGRLFDYTDQLIDDLVSQVAPGSTVTYTWTCGDPAVPFEPHQALEGLDATEATFWIVFAKDPAEFPEGEPAWFPQDHPGCVPGGTFVSAPGLSAATLRWHEGSVVQLTTASGQQLSITPKHPVLTDRGWVPADRLVEGDHLVRCLDPHRAAGLVPHDDQRPTPVENIVAARWETASVAARAVPVAAKDFHGDGLDSEVCVVLADRDLGADEHPSFVEPVRHHGFATTDALAAGLTGASRPFEGLWTVGSPSLGLEGVSGDRPALLRCRAGVADELLLPRGAWLDAPGPEALVDRASRHADSLCDGLDALAGFVEFDELVDVQVHAFSGHVFNLHTDVEWYVADGIMVHNCQCDLAVTYGE